MNQCKFIFILFLSVKIVSPITLTNNSKTYVTTESASSTNSRYFRFENTHLN